MFLLTAQEMAEIDRYTIEELGIPGVVLMENAGKGATRFFMEVVDDIFSKRVVIVAGSGNNGGDGFVIARHLWCKGHRDVRVICLKELSRLKGDALVNCSIIKKLGVPLVEYTTEDHLEDISEELERSDVIIDAILGTGLRSDVRGLYRAVIERINAQNKAVLAVDMPSGLDSSTGKPLGVCVKALATATFGLPKIGQVITPGHNWVGKLKVVDIGIPDAVIEKFSPGRVFFGNGEASKILRPRADDSHKGTYGHLLVLSGSVGKTGAAALVSLGAARVGAGLVTLLIPESLNPILEEKLTEPMTVPIAETPQKSASLESLETVLQELANKTAFAIGPGISLHEETQELVRELLPRVTCPMVIDADGLTALKGHVDTLKNLSSPAVLTPHPGEMARLIDSTSKEVQQNRLEIAERFSKEYGVVVVLKGFRTIIAAPDGRAAINSSGNPGMASGGMGDVLTGAIGGFLAQRYDPFDAACLGVFFHGMAADRLRESGKEAGMLAGDLLDLIPEVMWELETNVIV